MSYKAFIGYSREDKTLAQSIHDSLTRIVQIQPYLAEIYPNYGEDFKERIKNELDNSFFMVVLLTNNGIHSQWVNQEVGYAYALKRRPRLLPLLQGLPHIIPISERQTELKGFITKDTTDILFLDEFPSFEYIIANVIFTIRSYIPRGLEEGILKVRITCFNCTDERGLPSEYEALMPSNETIHKTMEISPSQPFLEYTCPYCKSKNVIDIRTFFPQTTL